MHEFREKPSAPSHCFRFFFVVVFFHPFPSGGVSAGHCFWSDTVVSWGNRHNQRQSKSYQLSQGPQAPAEVTLSWLTSRIPAVNQRRVTDSGCSAPSHRLSWGCRGIIAKMKTVMVYRLPTLRPFTGVHDGNDKRIVHDGSLWALLIKFIALHDQNSEWLRQWRPLCSVVLVDPCFRHALTTDGKLRFIFTSYRDESESCASLGQCWSHTVPTLKPAGAVGDFHQDFQMWLTKLLGVRFLAYIQMFGNGQKANS